MRAPIINTVSVFHHTTNKQNKMLGNDSIQIDVSWDHLLTPDSENAQARHLLAPSLHPGVHAVHLYTCTVLTVHIRKCTISTPPRPLATPWCPEHIVARSHQTPSSSSSEITRLADYNHIVNSAYIQHSKIHFKYRRRLCRALASDWSRVIT